MAKKKRSAEAMLILGFGGPAPKRERPELGNPFGDDAADVFGEGRDLPKPARSEEMSQFDDEDKLAGGITGAEIDEARDGQFMGETEAGGVLSAGEDGMKSWSRERLVQTSLRLAEEVRRLREELDAAKPSEAPAGLPSALGAGG